MSGVLGIGLIVVQMENFGMGTRPIPQPLPFREGERGESDIIGG